MQPWEQREFQHTKMKTLKLLNAGVFANSYLQYFGEILRICPNCCKCYSVIYLENVHLENGISGSHLFFSQWGFMHIKDFLKVRSGAIYLLY